MRHTLRKYTSNRGSALFMVISTMTALMISCMAMYFSMVSARSSQYVVFNQMQANQSATSISRIVADKLSTYGSELYEAMNTLGVGESMTTDANGFKSLDPSNALGLDDPNIGAYAVTITCIGEDADGNKKFDIMVITSVGGNRDSVHMTVEFGGSSDPVTGEDTGDDGSGGDAELFAATGYIPNDAYISGGYYLTDVFYDTQFTYMNTFGGSGENRIGLNLYTGGDLMLGIDAMSVVHSAAGDAISSADVAKIGPVTWAIRGNYYATLNSDMGVRGGSQFLIGGDYYSNGNNMYKVDNGGYTGKEKLDDHVCIYVNGDFNGSGADLKTNTWLFVNGDVYNLGGNAQTNAKIFLTSNGSMKCTTSTPVYEWQEHGTGWSQGLTYDEAMELLGQKTQTISYYKWDLSANTSKSSTKHVDIRLNATSKPFTDDKGTKYDAYQSTFVFAYPGSESENLIDATKGGHELGVVGDSFIIDSVWTHSENNISPTILIDTGEDPNNIMTIKLSDVTGNGTFSWFIDHEITTIDNSHWDPNIPPYGEWVTDIQTIAGPAKVGTDQLAGATRFVLLKGRGTVLIDIPENVVYESPGYCLTGHIGWFLIEGGQIEKKTFTYQDGATNKTTPEHITFSGIDPQGKYSAKIVPYIHKTCNGILDANGDGKDDNDPNLKAADSDGCFLTYGSSTAKCNECKKELTQVSCNIHGDVNKFCSHCHPEKSDRRDWCKNHFDNQVFNNFYSSLSGENRKAITDKDNKVIYPTTNFMLVSCDESAEMRFSKLSDGSSSVNNGFFGFIYAPYMSYLAAKAAQAGGIVKLVGGMTVGDYDIQAIDSFIGCYPDKMPNELAGMAGGGSMAGGKLTGTSKNWKVKIGGYY